MRHLLTLVAGIGLLVAALAVTLAWRPWAEPAAGSFVGSTPPARFTLPSFELVDHDGSRVTSDDLHGKVVVLTFLDTQCREACPIIASHVARAWRLLSTGERGESVAVAISTDPHDDSPESIRTFLRGHRALSTFRYLTGPVPEMRRLWREFQILSSLESGDSDIHSAPVRIYDRDGVWRATLHAGADLTPENLEHDVRTALRSS